MSVFRSRKNVQSLNFLIQKEIYNQIAPKKKTERCFSSSRYLSQLHSQKVKLLNCPHINKNCCRNFLKWSNVFERSKKLLQPLHKSLQMRNDSTTSGSDRDKNSDSGKQMPRLLYIQNPLVWLSNKLDFRYLRTSWDPAFSEKEFTYGAKQAVSTVTQLLSENMFDSLKPLLTKNAMISLRRDVEILWADEVRRNIGLCPEDVQLSITRKLHFRRLTDKKYCDIDMVFIGLKFLESTSANPPLIFVDIIARFHRNYTEGISPEWTISAFKVRRFNIIPPKV